MPASCKIFASLLHCPDVSYFNMLLALIDATLSTCLVQQTSRMNLPCPRDGCMTNVLLASIDASYALFGSTKVSELTTAISQVRKPSPNLQRGVSMPSEHPSLLLVHSGFIAQFGSVTHRGNKMDLNTKKTKKEKRKRDGMQKWPLKNKVQDEDYGSVPFRFNV